MKYFNEPTRIERDLVVDQLRQAVSDGALTVEEFQDRLDAAYAVETKTELYGLVGGLVVPPKPPKDQRWLLPLLVACLVAAVGTGIGIWVTQAQTVKSSGAVNCSSGEASPAWPTTARAQALLSRAAFTIRDMYASAGGRYRFSSSQGLVDSLERVRPPLGATVCAPDGRPGRMISVVVISHTWPIISTEDSRTTCWMISVNASTGGLSAGSYQLPPSISYGRVRATRSGKSCQAGIASYGYDEAQWRASFGLAGTPTTAATQVTTTLRPQRAVSVPPTMTPANVQQRLVSAVGTLNAVLAAPHSVLSQTSAGKYLAADVNAANPQARLTALNPVAGDGDVSVVVLAGGVVVLEAQDVDEGCWMAADNPSVAPDYSGAYNFPVGVTYGWTKATKSGQQVLHR